MHEIHVDNGDIRLRAEVTGTGPAVVCVHGWPELAHSWRHQVDHLSAAGYRVVAMDVRGYGGSSAPVEVERYTLRELAGDVAAIAAAVSDEAAIVIGHDWGAPIAYHAAIRHPEQFTAVAGLSVPHFPPQPVSMLDVFDQVYADRFFYQLSFREPGVIEAQFDQDLRGALKRVFHALSGDAPGDAFVADAPRETPFLEVLPDPPDGPLSFMSDPDLDLYTEAFRRSGTVGGFNRYRAAGLDVVANADILGATVDQPSCFIAGERDAVRSMVPGVDVYEDPGAGCTDFRGSTIVPGVGHWVQQEAPAEVNAALDAFLATL